LHTVGERRLFFLLAEIFKRQDAIQLLPDAGSIHFPDVPSNRRSQR
jgi:hypothetical protein